MEKLKNDFKISFIKGDTYALAVKFKNITEDLRLAYFTVKENPDDAPLIQKSLGAGIDKIDDREYKDEKTYKIQLQPSDTANLEARVQYLYDFQVTIGNVVKTVLSGVFVVNHTVTGTDGLTDGDLEAVIDDEVETEILVTPATYGIEYEVDPVALAKIGDMATLTTTAKATVVQAISEVKGNAKTNAEEINKIKNGTFVLPKAKDASEKIGGKNISEIFESDGKTAKNATIAMYADNDFSKGTIEERLSKMGFKSGSIASTEELPFYATRGEVKRQGNCVIGRLEGTVYCKGEEQTLGTIPADFCTKEDVELQCAYSQIADSTGSVYFIGGLPVTITTRGEIIVKKVSGFLVAFQPAGASGTLATSVKVEDAYLSSNLLIQELQLNFGYETNPA